MTFEEFYDSVVLDCKSNGKRLTPHWQIEDMYDAMYYGYRRNDPDRWRFLRNRKPEKKVEEVKKTPKAEILYETKKFFVDSLKNLSDYNWTKYWHPLNIEMRKGYTDDYGAIVISSNILDEKVCYRIKSALGEHISIPGMLTIEGLIDDLHDNNFNGIFEMIEKPGAKVVD